MVIISILTYMKQEFQRSSNQTSLKSLTTANCCFLEMLLLIIYQGWQQSTSKIQDPHLMISLIPLQEVCHLDSSSFTCQMVDFNHFDQCFSLIISLSPFLDSSSKVISIIATGYICQNGSLCGFVKKHGVRARDDSVYHCKRIDLDKMVYFGFHNGTSGKHLINHMY